MAQRLAVTRVLETVRKCHTSELTVALVSLDAVIVEMLPADMVFRHRLPIRASYRAIPCPGAMRIWRSYERARFLYVGAIVALAVGNNLAQLRKHITEGQARPEPYIQATALGALSSEGNR